MAIDNGRGLFAAHGYLGGSVVVAIVLQRIKINRPAGVERFRLSASHFSLLVQRKVTKRKHLPREFNFAQAMWGAVAIFGQAIHGLVRKRPASMPAALRVSGYGRACDVGKIKDQSRLR